MHHVICLPPSGLPRGQSLGKVTQEEVDREGGGGGEKGCMTKPKLSPPWGLLSLKILNLDIKLVLIDLAFLFTRLKLFECIIRSWYTVSTSA